MTGHFAAQSHAATERALGAGLVVASAAFFAMAGIFTKSIQSDPWTIACWRGLVGGLLVTAYVLWRSGPRGASLAFGWRGRYPQWKGRQPQRRRAPVSDSPEKRASHTLLRARLAHPGRRLRERQRYLDLLERTPALQDRPSRQ